MGHDNTVVPEEKLNKKMICGTLFGMRFGARFGCTCSQLSSARKGQGEQPGWAALRLECVSDTGPSRLRSDA